jgi:hypothetical protein
MPIFLTLPNPQLPMLPGGRPHPLPSEGRDESHELLWPAVESPIPSSVSIVTLAVL